jgi:hypothetical protein
MQRPEFPATAVSDCVSTRNRFEAALLLEVRAFSDAKPVPTFAENALCDVNLPRVPVFRFDKTKISLVRLTIETSP